MSLVVTSSQRHAKHFSLRPRSDPGGSRDDLDGGLGAVGQGLPFGLES